MIFTNSRKKLLDELQVGQIVLLTDVVLHSITIDSQVKSRILYCMSTPITHVFTEDTLSRIQPTKKEIVSNFVLMANFLDR